MPPARRRGPRCRPRSGHRPHPGAAARRPVRRHGRRGGRRHHGAGWLVEQRPELLRGRRRRSTSAAGFGRLRRPAVLPDPGRREGLRRLPDRGPRHVGPRLDAPRGQRRRPRRGASCRLAVPGPDPDDAGRWRGSSSRRGRARRPDRRPRRGCSAGGRPRQQRRDRPAASATRCTPVPSVPCCATRSARRHPRGGQVQRHPGVAEIEVDCRPLPGTDGAAPCGPSFVARIGDELVAALRRRSVRGRRAGRGARDASSTGLLEGTLRDHDPRRPGAGHGPVRDGREAHDPAGRPDLRLLAPAARTRASAFLDRFHGVDERVGVDALRFGLPVLYDVVAASAAEPAGVRKPRSRPARGGDPAHRVPSTTGRR